MSAETRVAMLAIIVREQEAAEQINALLHEHSAHIIGRMGIPYREKGVSLISVMMDAPLNAINTLAGKIGRLAGVEAKTVLAPAETK